MREIEVVIDTEEIAEYFYNQLIKRGYIPKEAELELIADITFDYLLEKCIIDEELEENEFEDME
ncbi:YozD family protein [Metabacillus sp. RGM 3146]|uniref:YozD family protein n=1 Tax=Metabacillus sp. RGM 3146 TaxID=3401092 RepID=UPI003B9BFDA3